MTTSLADKSSGVEDIALLFLKRYHRDPVLFCKEILKATPDAWQEQVLNAMRSGDHKWFSIRSGHGVGKTALQSFIALWSLFTKYPVKVVATAPTSGQLNDALMSELGRWIARLPAPLRGQVIQSKGRVELKGMEKEAFIVARTSRAETPEALQGIHSENVVLIADEASAIPEAIFESAGGSLSGEKSMLILTGNPTRNEGYFFNSFTSRSGGLNPERNQFWSMRVSCLDSPRVDLGFVEGIKDTYGEESNAYKVRVLGEPPNKEDEAILSHSAVSNAIDREIIIDPKEPIIWGLDPARIADSNGFCKRQGRKVLEVKKLETGRDIDVIGSRIKEEYARDEQKGMRPRTIFVDAIGYGYAVHDFLKREGLPAEPITFNSSPYNAETSYCNLRAETWGKVKNWFKTDCSIPNVPHFIAELTTHRYDTRREYDKIKIEDKADIRKRLGRSPDLCDAFVLTFCQRRFNEFDEHGLPVKNRIKRQIRSYARNYR